MSDLILLHQELLPLIFYALDLVEVPCLPIVSPSHPINIILSFLRTQTLIKVLIGPPLCLTHRSFYSLLCYLVLLYIVCTPVMIQALIALILLNSLLHIFIPPLSVFRVSSVSFGHSKHLWSNLSNACCHLLPHDVCIAFIIPRALFNDLFLKDRWCLPF